MKTLSKIILVIFTSLLLANCSTYSVKKDMTKDGYVNKTPKWYVDYDHETWKTFQEAAVSVSPDMELAVKKVSYSQRQNLLIELMVKLITELLLIKMKQV